MPVQMIELEEVQMVETRDEALEAVVIVAQGAFSNQMNGCQYGTYINHRC